MNNRKLIEFLPKDRVKVFDHKKYKNDVSTPLSYTMRTGTVICVRGQLAEKYPINGITLGPYPNLIDVLFDGDLNVSEGHFAEYVEKIDK